MKFSGGRKKMVGKLRKHGDIRPVNKKDIPEKPQGVASPPPPLPVPARVRNESQIKSECVRWMCLSVL